MAVLVVALLLLAAAPSSALAAPAANDDLANAQLVTGSTATIWFDLADATTEPEEATAGYSRSIWFRWVAPYTGLARLTTSSSQSNRVTWYTGPSAVHNLLTELPVPGDLDESWFLYQHRPVTAGTTYWIQVRDSGSTYLDRTRMILNPQNAADDFDDASHVAPVGIDAWGESTGIATFTGGATREAGEPNHAGFVGNATVWVRFYASDTGVYNIDTQDSDFDTVLGVYSGGDVGSLTQLAANDDFAPGITFSRVQVSAVAGRTYHVAVSGKGAAVGTANIRIMGRAQADTFADPFALWWDGDLGYGDWEDVSLSAASLEPGEPSHGAGRVHSVWHRLQPTLNTRIGIEYWTYGSPGSMSVYSGSALGSLTPVTAGPDTPADSSGYLEFDSVAGTTYWLVATGAAYRAGEYFDFEYYNRQIGDDFASPKAVTSSLSSTTSYWSDTFGATREASEPVHAAAGSHSIWYTWTPATTTDVTITTQDEDVDTMLAAYTGASLGALSLVDSSDDAAGTRPVLQFTAVAGTTYRIALDSKGAVGGSAYIVFSPQAGPDNDMFAAADVVPPMGASIVAGTWGASLEPGEPQHGTAVGGSSLWWTWTAPATRLIAIDTLDSASNTQLAVYTGAAVNALTLVGRSEDWQGTGRGRVEFAATAGTTYRIAIDLEDGDDGEVSLSVEPPPVNDKFGGAISLGTRGRVTASTLGGSRQLGEPAHAGNPGGSSAWYSWVAPAAGAVSFSTEGSSFDTLLGVYTGNGVGTLVGVAANDDFLGTASQVTFTAVAGATYRIAVDGKDDARGTARLRWNPVAHDAFASAQAIAGTSVTTSADLGGTGTEAGEPVHAAGVDGTAWYSWTAPVSGIVGISSSGSAGDTVLAAYTGATLGALSLVQMSDDVSGTTHARLRFSAVAGTTYRIALATRSATSATAWLRLNEVPANDNFAAATALAGAQPRVVAHNFGSTVEGGEPAHAGQASTRSVWWTWTAPTSTPVTIDTRGSDFDTLLAVYTGAAVGSLTGVTSNDNGAGISPQSRVSFAATAGTTYRIAVAGLGSDAGEIVLAIDAPANDYFSSAVPITIGSSSASTTAGTTTELSEPNVRVGTYSSWYSWTPGADELVEVLLTSSGSNATVNAYVGAAMGSLVPATAMRIDNNTKRVQIDGTAGTTYWIQVTDRTGTGFTLAMLTPPPNDHFTGATVMAGLPASVAGTTVGATFDRVTASREYDGAYSALFDRWQIDRYDQHSGTWYRWTAPSTQTVEFSVSNSAEYQIFLGTDEDDLRVLEEDPVDEYGEYQTSSGTRRVNVVAGTEYVLYVGADYWTNTSAVTVSVTSLAPLLYDAFASPKTLANPADWHYESNFGTSTCEAGEPSHGGQACEGTVWFSWTPTASGTGVLSTQGSDMDTMIAIYTGTIITSLTSVASNDDVVPGTVQSRVEWAVTAGTTYRIAVGRRNGQVGVLRATAGIMVANDKIASASPIATDNAVLATQTFASSMDLGDGSAHSVWHTWTPSYTGMAQVSLANASAYNYLTVSRGTFGAFTSLPSRSAPAVPSDTATYGTGESAYEVTAGTPLTLRAYANFGWWDSALDIRLNQSSANEAFASSWTVDPASTRAVSDYFGAGSAEAGEPVHAGVATTASLWYSFTPTVTRTYRLDTHASSPQLDTVLAVYTGAAVNALTPVASANDTLATSQEHLTFTGTAGTTYRIAIARVGAGYGFATLRIDAPQHDLRAGAVTLTGASTSWTGTLANGHHHANEGSFVGSSASTVWYQWTAPNTGPVILDTLTGTNFDSQVTVYDGPDPATASLLGKNDDYGGTLQSRIDFSGVAGTTYWILVGTYGSSSTGYNLYDGLSATEGNLTLRVLQAPGNDDFADAVTMGGWSSTATSDTTLATFEDGEPVHAGTPGGRSIWYRWTAPVTGPVIMDTFGSTADTVLAVYTGTTLTGLTPVAGNDDWNTGITSLVSFQGVAGTEYYVAIDSFRAVGMAVSFTINARPPNDDFVNAIDVSGTAAEAAGYNTNATSEASEPAHAGSAASDSIWYTWIAPASGATTIDTLGSAIDTRLAVYTGAAVGSLTLVAQNDDAASTTQSRVTFAATAGVTYRIAIDGGGGANGDILLRVNASPPSVPLLVAPSDGANSSSLTPGLQARFQHPDVAALGQIQFEVCRAAVAPADPWSSTCASGYQAFSTGMSLSHGSVGTASPPVALAQAQTHVWRAREFDGSAWSGWTGSRTFTAQASVSVAMSTLGYLDASRMTGGWSIAFGSMLPGSVTEIGPAGSGQATAGSAITYTVTSDGTTTTTAQGTNLTGPSGTIPISQIKRRDRTAGETIQELAWTPFATTSQTVEQDGPGTTIHGWDLQMTVPAGQAPGSYSGSVSVTTVANP